MRAVDVLCAYGRHQLTSKIVRALAPNDSVLLLQDVPALVALGRPPCGAVLSRQVAAMEWLAVQALSPSP